MRHHLKHLLMCAPMIVLAGVLIATGSGAAVLVPVAMCTLMMVAMMSIMSGGGGHDGGDGR